MRRLHVIGYFLTSPHPRKRNCDRFRRWNLASLVLAVVIVTAGCADDTENRRFANDPRTPVGEPTELATPASDITPSAPQALPSPEALVQRRGAPETIYVYVDGALRSVDGDTSQVVVEGDVAAFAASPGGDNVAVVTTDASDASETGYSVTIYTPDGDVAQTFEDVLSVPSDPATPAGGGDRARAEVDLDWAAQGGRLLLTHSSGQLIDIPIDGEPHVIETGASIEGAFRAEWSPRGDAIGVLIRTEEGRGELALVDASEEPARVTVIAPSGGNQGTQRSVEAFAWKANGSGVFFLEMRSTGQGLQGGIVLGWDRESNSTAIVATGGQAGPAGSVTAFSVSPDGEALAYRVALPSEDGWTFNGLFVRSLESGQVYRVPVSPTASVTGVWWFAGGLVWSEVEASEDGFTTVDIVTIDASGATTEIASFAPGLAATPAASLVTGAATPDASPVASPPASPQATPVD